jgi:phage portal protein BeeE
MADLTAAVFNPGLAGVTPTYSAASAADYFTAAQGGKYMLHYKNGATPTTVLKVTDATTPVPAGSTAVAGFADLQVSAALGASAERVVWIDGVSRFRDANGRVNLVNGTPTTLTVAIFGPF